MSELTFSKVDDIILGTLRPPKKTYWLIVTLLFLGILMGAACWGYQIMVGIGVGGHNHPIMWGTYLINFVFWVGIAHSGTLISAILYLFRLGWRNPIARAAETMTIFAIGIAGLFPFIHLGRVWMVYFMLPYPNQRDLWPNFQSPLLFDMTAISSYLLVSLMFWYTGLLPDLATVRDRSVGIRKKMYRALSLGWTGRYEQWRHFARAYLLFAALATPLVISVHSIVSWDFALALLPGWHSTLFAPYFVAGAIHSGLAMVLTLMIPMRKIFHYESIITLDVLEMIARTIIFTGLIVFYSYAIEYFLAWYSQNPVEIDLFFWRATGEYAFKFWGLMFFNNSIIPLLLFFRKIRRSIPWLFLISILINIGMWYERFVIIISSPGRDFIPYSWGLYSPSWVEIGILIGSFCIFFFLFLLFAKHLPSISMTEIKEGISEGKI